MHASREIILYWFTLVSWYLFLSVWLSLFHMRTHTNIPFLSSHRCSFSLSLFISPFSLTFSICAISPFLFSCCSSILHAGSPAKHSELCTTELAEGAVRTHPIMFSGHFIRQRVTPQSDSSCLSIVFWEQCVCIGVTADTLCRYINRCIDIQINMQTVKLHHLVNRQ